MLALFAHPDDEAYSAAGVLAACAGAGARVVIVSATRGDDPIRRAELAASCVIIGAEEPRFLGLPDGGVRDRIVDGRATIRRWIEELRPNTLITHGPDGGYGHVDHVACSAICRGADVRRLLHVCFPAGLFSQVRQSLTKGMPHLIDPSAPECAPPTHTIALGPLASRKRAAIAAHSSQRHFFSDALVDALADVERYRLQPPL